MIRKLQFLKTAVLSVFLLGGANLAWADSKTIYPSTAMKCRIVPDAESYKYYDASSNPTTITAGEVESSYLYNGSFILEEWDFSEVDVARIKSITITNFNNAASYQGRIWIYGSSLPSTTVTAPTLAATMNTVMGAYPNVKTSGTEDALKAKALVAGAGSGTYKASGIYERSMTIDGANLTTFKENISGNKIVLVSSATPNSSVSFRTITDATYKPKMVIEYYPVTVTIGETTTNYEKITSTLKSSLTDNNATIKIYDNVDLEDRIEVSASKTIDVLPQKDGVTITNTQTNKLFFLSGTAYGTINVGSDTYSMVFKCSNSISVTPVEAKTNSTSVINFNNVTFKGITTSKSEGIIKAYSNGKVSLKNVTFDGCASTDATLKCIVSCGTSGNSSNDGIILEGNNRFINCTGHDIHAYSRFKVHNNGVTNTTPIKVYTASITAFETPVATNVAQSEIAKFDLQNETRGLAWRTKSASGSRRDMWLTEAYTLNVGDANAATLVLPFTSNIPENVSCYTLTHENGSSTVNATPVETTLPANTPVLINAAKGKHKFVNPVYVSAVTTGSDPVTEGALTGVYASTTVQSGSYILYYKSEDPTNYPLGFYKADGTTNTVAANRAYLTPNGSVSPARLAINFDGDDTTGIEAVSTQHSEEIKDNVYYDLSGRRVAQPTKGLYIVNGKKVFIK